MPFNVNNDFASRLAAIIAQNKPQFQAVSNHPAPIPETKTVNEGHGALGLAVGQAGGRWVGNELMDRYGPAAKNHRADVLHTTASLLDESTWEKVRHSPNTQAQLKDMNDRGDSRVVQENDGTFTFNYYIPKSEAAIKASALGKISQGIDQQPQQPGAPMAPQQSTETTAMPETLPNPSRPAEPQELSAPQAPQAPQAPPSIDPRLAMVAGMSPTQQQYEAGAFGEPARAQSVATTREINKESIDRTVMDTKRIEKEIPKLEAETARLQELQKYIPEESRAKIDLDKQQVVHLKNADKLATMKYLSDLEKAKSDNKDIRVTQGYERVKITLQNYNKQSDALYKDASMVPGSTAFATKTATNTRALLTELDGIQNSMPLTIVKDAQGKTREVKLPDTTITQSGIGAASRAIDMIHGAILKPNAKPAEVASLYKEALEFYKYCATNGVNDPIMDKKMVVMMVRLDPSKKNDPAVQEIMKNVTPEEMQYGVNTPWYKTIFGSPGKTSSGGAYDLPAN